jgi:hypothetical protein
MAFSNVTKRAPNVAFPRFDRKHLKILPLSQREHDMDLSYLLELDAAIPDFEHPALPALAEQIVAARRNNRSVILVMGAHLIKQGLSHFVIDLLERDFISHVAMNGAGPIHDWELALIGASTERVAKYIQKGQFGLWEETAQINDVLQRAVSQDLGFGEAVGKTILDGDFPHKDCSILAACVRLNVPVTVHVGIGYDIIHEHPNCDGASVGETSYRDFLVFAKSVENLEGGVLLNFGSAVMGPEVYLKALSMARNVAHQKGLSISQFHTAVFDLVHLTDNLAYEPPKSQPEYYYRPFKTILVRTVADGGESHYVQGDHRLTLPAMHKKLLSQHNRND